jgi:hypothetical protein
MRPSSMESRLGRLFCAALVVASGALALAQKPDKKADSKAEASAQAQAAVQNDLIRAADAAMAGQVPASDFPIQFQNDFLKAQGNQVWIPMTLTLDPTKVSPGPIALYLRVVPRGMAAPAPPSEKDRSDKKKKDKSTPPPAAPTYPFQDLTFTDLKPPAAGEPLRLVHGVGVPAGSYDLYVVLRQPPVPGAGAKTGILKQPLEVPNFSNGEFSTSTVLLATRLEQLPAPLPPDQQADRPYALGQSEIVVSPDHKFKKTDELLVLLQVYNPSVTDKKFNLEAAYTFYQQGPAGEKLFNHTEPQTFTSESMGPGFDPTSPNNSIQAGQGIPLQSFPEGTYRLEIKITDKISLKVLTQNVTFTVSS